MIPTRKRIKRLKPKKRASYYDRYDDDEGRRVKFPQFRISKRAKEIILKESQRQSCTQSALVEEMLRNYLIIPNLKDMREYSSGREKVKMYAHPVFIEWIYVTSKELNSSPSLFFSSLIEHYYDKYHFELNSFKLWDPTIKA